jgi:hypothetical protein
MQAGISLPSRAGLTQRSHSLVPAPEGEPSAAGGGEADNAFDAPVHYLLKYKVGGLPLPYFVLLKIAQDILAIGGKTIRQ